MIKRRTPPTPPPDVVYSAPNPDELDRFARQVCRRLGPDYTELHIVDGLSTFIKVAVQIQVKHLNQQNQSNLGE